MVRAVRPSRSLSMARGCARIDSRIDTVKISLAGRVEVHHARLLAVIGVRKTFPHGLDPKWTFHVARSAIRKIRSINKSRADFLVSFEQSGRQSDTLWLSCLAGLHSHSRRSREMVVARLLWASNQCQLGKERLDQNRLQQQD